MTNSNCQFTGWCSVSNTLKSEPIHHISPGRASKDGRFTQALYTCTWIMPSCSNPVICSSENLHLLICTQTHRYCTFSDTWTLKCTSPRKRRTALRHQMHYGWVEDLVAKQYAFGGYFVLFNRTYVWNIHYSCESFRSKDKPGVPGDVQVGESWQ